MPIVGPTSPESDPIGERPMVVTPPRRAATLRRVGILILPLLVVLLGVAWARLADWSYRIPTGWGYTASAACALLLVDWIRSLVRRHDPSKKRLAVLRPALVAATFAVLLADPFVWLYGALGVAIATAINLPLALSLWPLARSGAGLATVAMVVFVASSVACMMHNVPGGGLGFFLVIAY